MTEKDVKELSKIEVNDIDALFSKRAAELHKKVDATRDAYLGFIFPITRQDCLAVGQALDLGSQESNKLFILGTRFSTFHMPRHEVGQLTNHIFGASILALRNRSLDSGLSMVTDKNLAALVAEHEEAILEIANLRASWFGRIFFPATAFASAIGVFGGRVKEEVVFDVANKYGYAAMAGKRHTIRGDFGIATWLTLLGRAS